jgi:hypothetical protein
MANYCLGWKLIESFGGWDDYENKKAEMAEKIKENQAVKVTITSEYGLGAFEENWYQCEGCGKIWRLIKPDPPFTGLFLPVDSAQPDRS